MCEVPVFYASTEGQTRRIAEHLAVSLRDQGLESAAIDVGSPEAARVDWSHVRGVFLGASLHAGHHQRRAERFAREHRHDLSAHPSIFFSVSLAAGAADPKETAAAWEIAESFPRAAGWTPDRVVCLAGRLAYTQYGFLKRWIMRRISRKHHGPTDASRDFELTNWNEVAGLAAYMGRRVQQAA